MPRRPRARLKLPSDVQSALPLERGERPLAWATDTSGQWYVGTDRAWYRPATDRHRRIPWEEVERAEWDQERDMLIVLELPEWGGVESRIEIPVAEPGRLLELIQERVTKSVVSTTYAAVHGQKGLTVIARRSPTGQGPLVWSYVLSRGLDSADPEVAQKLQEAHTHAMRELGELP